MPFHIKYRISVAPGIMQNLGLLPTTHFTESDTALKKSSSFLEIAGFSSEANFTSACESLYISLNLLTSFIISSLASLMFSSGINRLSMLKVDYPGTIFTLRPPFNKPPITKVGLLERGSLIWYRVFLPDNLFFNFINRDANSVILSKEFTPLCGIDAWLDFPLTVTSAHKTPLFPTET